MCSASPAKKRKTKTLFKKIATILRSLNGGHNMLVSVFLFMLQLIVYVREKYTNYQCLRIQAARFGN